MTANVILIKYAEIALKGKNRRDFEQRLVNNIAAATGAAKSAITRLRGRIVIDADDDDTRRGYMEHLDAVIGVHSFTHALVVDNDIEAIKAGALQRLADADHGSASFAVDARRAVKTFEYTSQQINEAVGAALQEAHPGLVVDLDNPDFTITVEVREHGTYIYTDHDESPGLGGLPVGVSGRGLALMSGGIDSPVAAWLMLKRGLAMDAVYFHSAPFTGEKAKEKVLDCARVLARYKSAPMTVYTPSLAAIQKEIADKAPEPYWTILFRRSMQRIAERVATDNGYQALTTGDSLAQVASQTPENLTAVDAVSEMVTLRPLTGYDKRDIIDLSSTIGTYDISTRPYEDCCSVFTPDAPKTKAKLADVVDAEAACDLEQRERDAVEQMQVFSVTPTEVKELYN